MAAHTHCNGTLVRPVHIRAYRGPSMPGSTLVPLDLTSDTPVMFTSVPGANDADSSKDVSNDSDIIRRLRDELDKERGLRQVSASHGVTASHFLLF